MISVSFRGVSRRSAASRFVPQLDAPAKPVSTPKRAAPLRIASQRYATHSNSPLNQFLSAAIRIDTQRTSLQRDGHLRTAQ